MDFNLAINLTFVLGNSLSSCSLFETSSLSTTTQTTKILTINILKKLKFRVEVRELGQNAKS